MNVGIHENQSSANAAAASLLAEWLIAPGVRNILVAAGNSPLSLYALIFGRGLDLSQLSVFALDEYVGVPVEEPRNCANVLRRHVAEAWGIGPDRYFTVSSSPADALQSVHRHERLIVESGGLDVAVLGVGQNGHLGFNEPGSAPDSPARVIELEPVSVEANRQWFGGDYAPAAGATLGLGTILAARRILVLAFGRHKARAVSAMVDGPIDPDCPASLLRNHPATWAFLDSASAAMLKSPEVA